MIQLDGIDRLDGGLGIGIRREQHSLGVGIELHGFHHGIDPVHLRHAMIDQQERDGIIALLQSPEQIQRGDSRLGSQDAVTIVVTLAQIAFDRSEYIGIVVNGQDDWFCHSQIPLNRDRLANRGEPMPREWQAFAGASYLRSGSDVFLPPDDSKRRAASSR